ncbi:Mak10 subunit, NatC N-terminal acetyltransferase-domain-containing protein [Stachybotrys elegans]|uniref:Mak10 subunit, NatC N-terminal acetyltransferase-domain-containing protein n=1 Tax=Stachybotrys elegans TaxID=80388 RepID=A0A8K0WTF1_9HYPO|nr:Mak10 subunit, NatC N-terminal acetyltransferase-domain-containing protein [Stachybotrys elegans]
MPDYGINISDEIERLSLGQEPDMASAPPPPPPVNSRGIIAVDITEQFAQASKALAPGELVKDGFFTLFESVAAIEIMDPKMDSGCVKPGEQIEELYDVSRPLLPEEVLGIIDQLICHEMSWHLGYPLSQTLFTSVYVEALLMPNPRGINEARFIRDESSPIHQDPMLEVFRAYCLGMIKACGYVNQRIRSEHYYEEEDFVTNTYSRSLLEQLPTQSVQETILAAEAILKSRQGAAADQIVDALLARLELRRALLEAAECVQHMKEPGQMGEPWKKGLEILPRIKSTQGLGKPVDEAFSAKLQMKLASTMPPRPIVKIGFDDAFGHLQRLFQDGFEVVGVLNYTDSQCLQSFVTNFQAKKPQPLVYVRTLLQTFLFNAMEILGSMSIRQLLDDDFSIIVLPASPLLDRDNDEIEAVEDPRFTISAQMELFRQRAAQPFLDVLRTACQNRSRVRRTLCHSIRDWENLQLDAEEIDQIIQVKTKEQPIIHKSSLNNTPVESYALPLSSWSYLYKLRKMEEIVQLGFELEVYQQDELAGMYWYLNHLSKSRVQHVERIKTFVVHRAEEAKKSRTRDQFVEKQVQRSLAYTCLALLDAAVTWELSDTLSCLYTVLHRLNLIKIPTRPYSNDELRYEVRMKPFGPIGLPAMPTFEEFTIGTQQPDATSDELLDYADRALAGAKKGFETLTKLTAEESFSVGSYDRWLAGAKNGLKSCIATGIAISTVRKGLHKSSEGNGINLKVEIPTPDKTYHDWWIIPRVVVV